MKRRALDYKARKNMRRQKLEDLNVYIHYLKMVLGWVAIVIVDSLLCLRVEFIWPLWGFVHLLYNCMEIQGMGYMAILALFALFWDVVVSLLMPISWSFFVASTLISIQYIWNHEKGVLQLPSVIFMMLVAYMEISIRFNSPSVPFRVTIFRPLAAHSITFCVILLLNLDVLFTTDKKKLENGDWLKSLDDSCEHVSCKHACNYANGNIKQSSGVIQSLTDNKSNQKKQWDKNDLNYSINSDDVTYSSTSGSIPSKDSSSETTEKVISERIQSINDYIANGKEKDCGKNNKNCSVPLKSNSNYKESNNPTTANIQKDKKSKSNRDCNVSQASSQKDDYYQRLEAQLKKTKLDLQISQQVEVNLRNQINTLNQETKNAKHELYKAHRQNDELQSKLHNLVTTKQADKQNIANLEKKLIEEKKQKNILDNQLQNLKKSCKKNEELINKNECSECCKMRRINLETENKRLKKELKEKEELYCSAKRDAASLCKYKEKLKDVNLLVSKLSAMKEQTTHLEHSLRSETKIKLDLFSALGEVKRQLDIREKLIKTQEVEIEHLKYAINQLKRFNSTNLSSLSSFTFEFDNDEITPSLLDPNATSYTPNYIKSHLSLGT